MIKEGWCLNIRPEFFKSLHEAMAENENIWALTGDLGFGGFDKIREDFPQRFVNCGASEQTLVGIGVGLALKGKIPFCYSITPFLLRRAYETIRLYVSGEKIPVKLIGSGRDKDYSHDGPSHDATDVRQLMTTLPNVIQYWPREETEIKRIVNKMVKNDQPSFLSLRR